MAWVFSKRCQQALKDKKIEVSIPRAARIRILHLLERFNEYYDIISDNGFVGSTTYLNELPKKIKAELGLPDLIAFPESGDGPAKPSNLQGFILRGNYPPYLFDAIELFCDLLEPAKGSNFQKAFNQILEESNLSWRMADGKIFPVDSSYIEEQITRIAYELLHEMKFQGALQEFEKARIDFVNGDYSGAIQNANLAVEGAIKGILIIQKAKPGELFRKIIDSGYPRVLFRLFESFRRKHPEICCNYEE